MTITQTSSHRDVGAAFAEPARERIDGPAPAPGRSERQRLAASLHGHALYRELASVADLRLFMAHHVICVWDFMALVKSLQRDICGSSSLWLPPPDADAARFLNEIVLDEESDAIAGRHLSHFELYLEAMDEVGADTAPMRALLGWLRANAAGAAGVDHAAVVAAARDAGVPEAAVAFLATSLALLERSLPARVAAFFYGREQAIPPMFSEILAQIRAQGLRCDSLAAYLERHIDCDGERHGPMAAALLATALRGAGEAARGDAEDAAEVALRARIGLWDAIRAELGAAQR
ncbi:MAG: DUF3050 domain-containing protein [Haliangiales bacterium]